MANYRRPLWLEEIVNNNTSLKMGSSDCGDYIMIGSIASKNKKIRVAILRDGPFLPVMTGASASILGMANSLANNNIEVVLIKCLRESDNVNLYKKQSFPTVFIDEESFYGGKENILRKILIDYAIDIVHFDSAEAINIQAKYIPREIYNVLEVHNVEYDLLRQNNADDKIISYIKKQEIIASSIVDALLFRSAENLDLFSTLGVNGLKIKSSIYRGGINTDNVSFCKERFNKGGDVLFLGHLNYGPNIQALKIIKKFIAPYIKQNVLAVGNCGENIKREVSSKKIKFLGRVDNLNQVFDRCSVALAPLITGSGTRLKILDYLAAGLPVISTDLSYEGLEPEIKKHLIIENDFTKYPHHINNIETDYSTEKSVAGRCYVLKNRAWDNVIIDIIEVYKKLMLKNKICSTS